MMKNILIIFFLFLSYNVVAQQRFPTGPPTQFSTGFFRQGYPMSDSGLIVANRDTNWLAKYSGTVVFKPSNKKFYWFDSTTLAWNQFADAIDTTSLSNRINLKLNIADTTNHWWGIGKRWVDTVYRVNDSTIGYTINGGAQQTFEIKGGVSGGGGSGTVTSVGLSLPSAFNVTPSSITTSGTFAVTGAGTTSQYIRGNGTLATTDTGMIPNFHLKVRSLITGTSPITFNQTTGAIGINNANTTGTKGAASFTSSFSDNGSGLIDLADLVSAGSCTGCILNINAKGRITGYSDGPAGATNNVNIGSGYRILNSATQEVRTIYAGGGMNIDSVLNTDGLTFSSENISNASLTADGDYTQNWSNKQLYVDSIAGQFLFRMGGVGSTGTRRKEFRINWGGSSFGDNLDGYHILSTIRKGDNSGDSLTMGVMSSGTNVFSVGGFNTTNATRNTFTSYNFPFGLLTISAPDSIWMRGATPAATGDSLLALVNRGANGIAKVVKIPLAAAGGGVTLNNLASGFRWVATPGGDIKTVYNSNTILWDSTSTANTLTAKADTSVLATQYDISLIAPGLPLNSIQFNNAGTFGGDSLQYYPSQNKLLTSQDYMQYGRPVVGHFQDSGTFFTSGYLWQIYPQHSNGSPGQAVDPSWGADTLMPWYSNQGTVIYDVNQPPNSAVNLIAFGTTGNFRPMMRMAFEQNFYNTTEMHFATKPRIMNPNDEIRHWSWTIDQISGDASIDTRATRAQFIYSDVASVDYNRPFLGIGANGVLAQTWGHNGTMSVTHGNSAAAKTIGMIVDTAAGGAGVGAFYVSPNTPFLYIGSAAGGTGIDISNPATAGGVITFYKSSTTYGTPLGVGNIASSSPVGLYVTTPSVGYVFNVSTDANGFADVNTAGKYTINVDPAGFGASDIMFKMYGSNNFADSILNIRGNGDVYHKGMITANADSTTSATGGFVYRDAATGNFRITAGSSSGITTLNTLTASTQTFATGTSGTDFNISSATSTHTFNIPSASTSNRGLVTTISQTFGGLKTFNDGVYVTNTAGTGRLRLTGNMSGASGPSTAGCGLQIEQFTFTDNAAAGTQSGLQAIHIIGQPTITSGNAITYSGDAVTFRINGAPNPSGSMTLSHPWSIYSNDVNYLAGVAMALNEQAGDATIANASGVNIYTGTGGNTWTLPALATHPGKFIFIKNAGSGNLTVQRAGSDNIYNTSSVTSITVAAGADVVLAAGSSFWYVIGL